MVDPVQSYRRAVESPSAQREKWWERLLFALIFLLLAMLVVIVLRVVELKDQLQRTDEGVFRSQQELINGGKRFIDYLFSLNATTVDHDQFRALQMIVDDEIRAERLAYLKHEDLIRRTEQSGMKSSIDWPRSRVIVTDDAGDLLTVDYHCYITINQQQRVPLNIILVLRPVERSDDNPDGVGVVSWTDVAANPFQEQN